MYVICIYWEIITCNKYLLLFAVFSPTLYIGEEGSVIYALPSLVDENTVRVMVIMFLVAKRLFSGVD